MIVYNITIKIDPAIEITWLQWQKEEHIPAVMATGQFRHFHFFRLLEQDDSEGATYVVQFFTDDMEKYYHYMNDHAPALKQAAHDKWGNRFISFNTVMQIVN